MFPTLKAEKGGEESKYEKQLIHFLCPLHVYSSYRLVYVYTSLKYVFSPQNSFSGCYSVIISLSSKASLRQHIRTLYVPYSGNTFCYYVNTFSYKKPCLYRYILWQQLHGAMLPFLPGIYEFKRVWIKPFKTEKY